MISLQLNQLISSRLIYVFWINLSFLCNWINKFLLSRSASPRKEVKEEGPAVKQEFWWDNQHSLLIKQIWILQFLGGNSQGRWPPCSRWRPLPRSSSCLVRSRVQEVGSWDWDRARRPHLGVVHPHSLSASTVLIARWFLWPWYGSLVVHGDLKESMVDYFLKSRCVARTATTWTTGWHCVKETWPNTFSQQGTGKGELVQWFCRA